MIGFAKKFMIYTNAMEQCEFEASALNYDATIRNLELIGEAASHIPDDIRKNYQEIPWRQVIAARNHFIHGYLGIDNDTLWSITKDDIPILLLELQKLKDKEE